MTEDAFIAAVLAEPDADAPRLVYADWLEELRDPRAEFLRLECELLKLPADDERSIVLRARLQELTLALEPDWVALVRKLPIPDAMQAALSKLEDLLPGLNYVVFLDIYRVPLMPEATPERYIRAALGPNAVLGGIQPVGGPKLLAEVERCLRYPGDRGHGPDPSALSSPEFNQLVHRVLAYLERSLAEATSVARFWLREGHPFYPVMWDFAYVFVKPRCAVVLLGASSD